MARQDSSPHVVSSLPAGHGVNQEADRRPWTFLFWSARASATVCLPLDQPGTISTPGLPRFSSRYSRQCSPPLEHSQATPPERRDIPHVRRTQTAHYVLPASGYGESWPPLQAWIG